MSLSLPAVLPVEALKKPGCEYDADSISRHEALYRAGRAFRERKSDFLVRRKVESSDKGQADYAARLARAPYIARASGLLDWFLASVFRSEPRLVAPADVSGYWEGLNTNIDGLGTTLPALWRDALREVLLHNRSYFAVDFTSPDALASDPDTKAAVVRLLRAEEADDWERDAEGSLSWLRRHTLALARPAESPWLPADRELHYWAYFTATEIAIYAAEKKRGSDFTDKDAHRVDGADGFGGGAHDFGALPVFDIRPGRGQWVMERLYDVIVALFNRESAIQKYLDDGAFQMFALYTGRDVKDIYLTDISAMRLDVGDKAEWLAPQPAFYSALRQDAQDLKAGLYEVVQALALNAVATQTQNARQSAKAKGMDRDPLQVLLASFAWPVRDAFMRLVEALKRYRGEEELEVRIEGLDDFEETLAAAKKLISGAGTPEEESDESEEDSADEVDAEEETEYGEAGRGAGGREPAEGGAD